MAHSPILATSPFRAHRLTKGERRRVRHQGATPAPDQAGRWRDQAPRSHPRRHQSRDQHHRTPRACRRADRSVRGRRRQERHRRHRLWIGARSLHRTSPPDDPVGEARGARPKAPASPRRNGTPCRYRFGSIG